MGALRCRPGDQAILIGGSLPENIGMLVTVMHWYEGIQWWMVAPAHEPVRVIREGTGEVGPRRRNVPLCCPDCLLQPIRGKRQPQSITTAEPACVET